VTQASRIVFLADAGPAVGGGHVMRCLTLAQALMGAGERCAFIETPAAKVVLDAFADPAVERLIVVGGSPDDLAAQGARAGHDWSADLAVIDHYGFAPDHEGVVAKSVRRMLVVDDLRRPHVCDLVLDSNLGRTAADYPGQAALTGIRYALVRPGFAALREDTIRRRRAEPPVSRILVSLGLTDVGGITARVVEALAPVLGEIGLDVAVGGAAPSLPRLRALVTPQSGIVLHVDTTQMAALMARADLAIGAGGSSTWERCCLGLPTVLLVLADNQRPNALALAAEGAAVVVEADGAGFDERLRACVATLIASAAERRKLSEAAARLCDGRGANLVVARLRGLLG
jgi:UDP-2,4-diacetamido-2,4,6-trideoxy-beta-L-altropyranose hydrolase